MYKILMHEYSDCCDKNAYILLNFIYLYFVYFVYLVYFSVNPKGNITSTGGRIFVKYTSAICNTAFEFLTQRFLKSLLLCSTYSCTFAEKTLQDNMPHHPFHSPIPTYHKLTPPLTLIFFNYTEDVSTSLKITNFGFFCNTNIGRTQTLQMMKCRWTPVGAIVMYNNQAMQYSKFALTVCMPYYKKNQCAIWNMEHVQCV